MSTSFSLDSIPSPNTPNLSCSTISSFCTQHQVQCTVSEITRGWGLPISTGSPAPAPHHHPYIPMTTESMSPWSSSVATISPLSNQFARRCHMTRPVDTPTVHSTCREAGGWRSVRRVGWLEAGNQRDNMTTDPRDTLPGASPVRGTALQKADSLPRRWLAEVSWLSLPAAPSKSPGEGQTEWLQTRPQTLVQLAQESHSLLQWSRLVHSSSSSSSFLRLRPGRQAAVSGDRRPGTAGAEGPRFPRTALGAAPTGERRD